MSQVNRWLNQLSGVVRVAHSQLCFDVGSSFTRVGFQGKVVYNQPSCATYHEPTASLVQLGEPALTAADRTTGAVSAVFPIRQGYITDLHKVKLYLTAVMNQALSVANQKVVVSLGGKYAIPASLSPVEKQMLERVLREAGISQVQLIPKPEAIMAGLQTRRPTGSHLGIIDVGGQTTEVGLFVGAECRAAATIYIGGDRFTQKIQELARAECQAIVGWQTAERLKIQQKNLPFEPTAKDNHTLAVRAKNLLNLSPTTVFLKRPSMQVAFAEVAEELFDEITAFFAQQEPELVTKALEQGIYVTGGSSQLLGLTHFLEQRLKTQILKAPKPSLDVVSGLLATDYVTKA